MIRNFAKTTRSPLEDRSKLAFAIFSRLFERTLRQNFHALWMKGPLPPELAARKLVIYANHPSWWDAVAFVVIARRLLPGREVYSPMDAVMFRHYGFMRKIGAFAVEQNHISGAQQFLHTAREAIVREAPLMIAAQGRFADTRERPLRLRPGLAHLVGLDAEIVFLPLALDYTFWDEKYPEMFMSFGQSLTARELAALPTRARLAALEAGLTATLEDLCAATVSREAGRFTLFLQGKRGVDPIYDLWRRLR